MHRQVGNNPPGQIQIPIEGRDPPPVPVPRPAPPVPVPRPAPPVPVPRPAPPVPVPRPAPPVPVPRPAQVVPRPPVPLALPPQAIPAPRPAQAAPVPLLGTQIRGVPAPAAAQILQGLQGIATTLRGGGPLLPVVNIPQDRYMRYTAMSDTKSHSIYDVSTVELDGGRVRVLITPKAGKSELRGKIASSNLFNLTERIKVLGDIRWGNGRVGAVIDEKMLVSLEDMLKEFPSRITATAAIARFGTAVERLAMFADAIIDYFVKNERPFIPGLVYFTETKIICLPAPQKVTEGEVKDLPAVLQSFRSELSTRLIKENRWRHLMSEIWTEKVIGVLNGFPVIRHTMRSSDPVFSIHDRTLNISAIAGRITLNDIDRLAMRYSNFVNETTEFPFLGYVASSEIPPTLSYSPFMKGVVRNLLILILRRLPTKEELADGDSITPEHVAAIEIARKVVDYLSARFTSDFEFFPMFVLVMDDEKIEYLFGDLDTRSLQKEVDTRYPSRPDREKKITMDPDGTPREIELPNSLRTTIAAILRYFPYLAAE